MMTNKEIAERLRQEIRHAEKLTGSNLGGLYKLADELDPPKPEPGTVVWWRFLGGDKWRIGEVGPSGSGIRGLHWNSEPIYWESLEWKPARILDANEVAVKIPPTHEWGHRATDVEIRLQYWDCDKLDHNDPVKLIPRAEAKRMEADDD